jgi:23S rRNA (uracil1939-C5)-methyltransferase
MNKDAVEDAKRNAQLNSINNIEFIADKIENVIHKLVNKYEQQRLVAILDPPRAGVRK